MHLDRSSRRSFHFLCRNRKLNFREMSWSDIITSTHVYTVYINMYHTYVVNTLFPSSIVYGSPTFAKKKKLSIIPQTHHYTLFLYDTHIYMLIVPILCTRYVTEYGVHVIRTHSLTYVRTSRSTHTHLLILPLQLTVTSSSK